MVGDGTDEFVIVVVGDVVAVVVVMLAIGSRELADRRLYMAFATIANKRHSLRFTIDEIVLKVLMRS